MNRTHRRRSVAVLTAALALIGAATASTMASAATDGTAADRSLTITVLDPNGEPAASYPLSLYSEEKGFVDDIEIDGPTTIDVPAGRYNVAGFIEDMDVPLTVVHQPVDLTSEDQEVVLDTRDAVKTKVTVDDPRAETQGTIDAVGFEYDNGTVEYTEERSLTTVPVTDGPYVLPVRQEGLNYFQIRGFERWSSTRDAYYTVVDYSEGGLPSDPTFEEQVADMAKVTTTYRGPNQSQSGYSMVGLSEPFDNLPSTTVLVYPPLTVEEYYTDRPEFRWHHSYEYGVNFWGTPENKPTEYHGKGNVEDWDQAVSGPSLFCSETTSIDATCEPDAGRDGNKLYWSGHKHVALPADTRGRNWGERYAVGRVRMASDGEIITKRNSLLKGVTGKLPENSDTITLAVHANRDWEALSTKIDATYTFPAENTADGKPLPLIAVRYEPEGLDENNAAPAGESTTVPVWIEGYGDELEQLEIEASTDDGETWQPLDVRPTADGYQVTVDNPDSGYVSLRANATDTGGNAVEQTIIRAYQIAE